MRIDQINNLTMALGNPGLVLNPGTGRLSTAAFPFLQHGRLFQKAADADFGTSTQNVVTLTPGQACVHSMFALGANPEAFLFTVQGDIIAIDAAGEVDPHSGDVFELPALVGFETLLPVFVGYITTKNLSGADFSFGTTNWDAAGKDCVAVSCVARIERPVVP